MREGERQTDLLAGSVQHPHRVGGASGTPGATPAAAAAAAEDGAGGRRVGAVEPADAVEAEAVGAAVRAVEDGVRRVAGDGLARALDPAAVLRALALERTPTRGEGREGGVRVLSEVGEVVWRVDIRGGLVLKVTCYIITTRCEGD